MLGSYDYGLVILSVLISMLAASAALALAGRVAAARGKASLIWLMGGATASGIGTWSMHFTGMRAFSLPMPVLYDWPTVLLSLLPGVFGSAVALVVMSRWRTGWLRVLAGGVLVGGGISGMHYTAMASMRMPGMCHYSPFLVTLSIVLAILFSVIPLKLTFVHPVAKAGRTVAKVASVLLLGAANPVMHYTGMAAATFTRSQIVPDLSRAVSISAIGLRVFAIIPLMILTVALATSLADRLRKESALLDQLFEQAPQAVILTDTDNRVLRVNSEFTRVFGYATQEAIGRRLDDLIVPDESRDQFRKHIELTATHGQRVDAEGVRRRKDGSSLHAAISRVPVALPGGRSAVYAILSDITERKRAEVELQRSHDQLRALAARLQKVREEERTRVAREIHDELGQALTAIKIALDSLSNEMPEGKIQQSESIMKLADETIQSVRRISTELRPAVLDTLGLVAAVEWAVEEFEARTGTRCQLDLPQDDVVIDQDAATAMFRIFQETLTNVARHAEATGVNVRLAEEDEGLTLEVHDNGKGVNEEQLSAGSSLGILGMRERALLLGGELTITGAPGKGTTLRVRIPATHLTPPKDDD